MFELIEGLLTGTCTEKARAHDQHVAREYDEQNRRDVAKHQRRNNMLTGGTGLAVLGALTAFGLSKLGGDKKR